MKLSHTLKAALAASTLALNSCNEAPGTRENTQKTHDSTEAILKAHRTTSDEAEWLDLIVRLDRFKKLYTMLDDGEHTAQYFNLFSQENQSQGKDHELAGRFADVQARLATLVDLIQEKKVTEKDVATILQNNLLISGVHESESPKIIIDIKGNDTQFFQNDSPLKAQRKGPDVLLTKEWEELRISIKNS